MHTKKILRGTPSEAQFIAYGMTKDRWPCVTPELVQDFIDNPNHLDGDLDKYVDSFHYYYFWYWNAKNKS